MTTCKVAIPKEPSQIPQINIESRYHISILEESVARRHRLNRHEFEQTPGDGEGQGSLVYCKSMGSQRVGHDWATFTHSLWDLWLWHV